MFALVSESELSAVEPNDCIVYPDQMIYFSMLSEMFFVKMISNRITSELQHVVFKELICITTYKNILCDLLEQVCGVPVSVERVLEVGGRRGGSC